MLKRVLYEFSAMRPFANEVKGLRYVFGGVDHWPEIKLLESIDCRDVCIPFQLLGSKIVDEIELETTLSGMDVVILDSNSQAMEKAAATPEGFKNQCKDYLMAYKELGSIFTWGLAPYRAIDILGVDYYLAYLEEIEEQGLPIIPVIDRWEDWVENEVFKRHKYVALTKEVILDQPLFNKVLKEARRNHVALIAYNLEERYFLNRYPFFMAINSAWKNGSKWNTTFIFLDNQMYSYPPKEARVVRNRYKEHFQDIGLDFDQISTGVHWEVDKMNAIAWKGYARKLALNVSDIYWLTDLEKAEAKEKYLVSKGYDETGLEMVDNVVKLVRQEDGRSIWNHIEAENDGEMSFFDARMVITAKCDDCVVAHSCPLFKSGSRCAFKSTAPLRDMDDLKKMLSSILAVQNDRVQFGAFRDKQLGNQLSGEVSKEIQSLVKNSEIFHKMFKAAPGEEEGTELTISVKGKRRSFVQAFIEDDGEKKNEQGSIRQGDSRLSLEKPADAEVIQIEATEEKEA